MTLQGPAIDSRSATPLPAHELHLWCAPLAALEDAELEDAYRQFLNPDEERRASTFRFAADRRAFVLGRTLLRTTLSHHADVAPGDWRFDFNAQGKPRVAACHGTAQQLAFNLSHTRQLVALILGRQRRLGVDVEALVADHDPAIAERFFSPTENAALQDLDPSAQPTRFIELWALKESYLKARGTGLSLGLEGIGFDLTSADGIDTRFAPTIADQPGRWNFTLLEANPNHRVAVCCERTSMPPTLRVQSCVPLRGETSADRLQLRHLRASTT